MSSLPGLTSPQLVPKLMTVKHHILLLLLLLLLYCMAIRHFPNLAGSFNRLCCHFDSLSGMHAALGILHRCKGARELQRQWQRVGKLRLEREQEVTVQASMQGGRERVQQPPQWKGEEKKEMWEGTGQQDCDTGSVSFNIFYCDGFLCVVGCHESHSWTIGYFQKIKTALSLFNTTLSLVFKKNSKRIKQLNLFWVWMCFLQFHSRF